MQFYLEPPERTGTSSVDCALPRMVGEDGRGFIASAWHIQAASRWPAAVLQPGACIASCVRFTRAAAADGDGSDDSALRVAATAAVAAAGLADRARPALLQI